jgi:hypothetical protein
MLAERPSWAWQGISGGLHPLCRYVTFGAMKDYYFITRLLHLTYRPRIYITISCTQYATRNLTTMLPCFGYLNIRINFSLLLQVYKIPSFDG